MEEKGPVELYDPKRYLETYYYTIRMPNEQPQLVEALLTKYREFFAKGSPSSYLGQGVSQLLNLSAPTSQLI